MSIVEWAQRTPALAQDDYVHLTYPGADTLSVLIYNELFLSKTDDYSDGIISEEEHDTIKASPFTNASGAPDEVSHRHQELQKLLRGLWTYDSAKPFIFTLPGFWLFLLVVLAAYILVWKSFLLRNSYLLIVSLFFYFKTGGLFVVILFLITLIDFACGCFIHISKRRSSKRFFLLLSLISNLGILVYFKYTGFIVETINNLAGTNFLVYDYLASFSNSALGTTFAISSILLPAGISFFTFQSLSYTFDIYRRKLEPVRNILDFGFYVSFFPQLVAGPIVRASEFIPQLYSKYNVTKREFSHALFMISKGLIKKIVISDFIAVNFVDRVFELPALYSGFENLFAVYGYGLQIYCDFSGYTDIAIGIALILGFRLPVNFNSPYKASDIADFWRRWHISLSRWLKDYLYISLGGNRKGKIRTGINLMITMLLGGLWHGAAMRFVIWGGLHGIGLIISRIWTSVLGKRLVSSRIRKVTGIFLTFNFVSFCWIFFRAPDMDSAWMMLRQIGENFSPGSWVELLSAYSSIFLLMGAGYIIHFLPEKIKESYRGLFIRMPFMLQLVMIALVAVLLIEMRSTDVMPFIYFRF
ncbi:MAG: MBOAT family protein [Bacteroidales bacterium]|nr:MBOAT family protein [Bacteroidales bacterium]